MRFLAIVLLALFIGGCGASGVGSVRMDIDRSHCRPGDAACDAQVTARVRGVTMDPNDAMTRAAHSYATVRAADGRRHIDAATADMIEHGYGVWGAIPMTDEELLLRGVHMGVAPADAGVSRLDRRVEDLEDGVDGVAESQRRLVEQLRGGGER